MKKGEGRMDERAKGRKDESSNPVPSLRGTKQSRTIVIKQKRSLCTDVLDCHAPLAMTKERLATPSSTAFRLPRHACNNERETIKPNRISKPVRRDNEREKQLSIKLSTYQLSIKLSTKLLSIEQVNCQLIINQ
jgi:hypothetical protein